MKCPKCNAENRLERLYCEQCGAPLEHDLRDVQVAVDQQIRAEKAKVTARAARWLLAVSIVLFFIGYYFRGAYKELPENDIVAFANAPTTPVDDRFTVTTDRFGMPLPPLKAASDPIVDPARRLPEAEVHRQAYQRAAVVLKHRGNKTPLQGLLVGDLLLSVSVPGQKEPVPVHIADVRSLRPKTADDWELRAVNLPGPVTTPIPSAQRIKLKLLQPQPGTDPLLHEIPLAAIESIEPVAPTAP